MRAKTDIPTHLNRTINKKIATPHSYSFQGQEADHEIKGEGNSVNYKYRMHDARIGRFFAVDPLTSKYPHYTPYSFSGNKVIHAIELEGLEELPLNNIVGSITQFLENVGKAAAVITTAVDIVNNATVTDVKKVINEKIEFKVGYDIEISARVTVGGRSAANIPIVKGVVGAADIDMGSVVAIQVSGTVDAKTGEYNGTVEYIGKDNKVIHTAGVTIAMPLTELGCPTCAVEGGYSSEEEINIKTGEVISSKEEIKAGFSAAVLGVSVVAAKEEDSNQTVYAAGGEVGVSGSYGVGYVGDISLSFKPKVEAIIKK